MLCDLNNLKILELEEKILKFWQDNKIFEKSLGEGRFKTKTYNLKPSAKGGSASGGKTFVFYDGPPFATGLPHYGHILASIIKDAVPRYKTMKGFRVPRRWGWDCHGLPIENEIENDMGFQSKKDIEKFGVEKFNEVAKASVLKYADEWRKIIPRIGRWVDMKNDYKTMDPEYTESVWWVFKNLYNKGLIYEGYKSMHICPRCETTLSNFEVTQNYRDIKDISVTVKFEILDSGPQNLKPNNPKPKTYLLAWTTTPWTLIGNAALAVGESIKYQVLSIKGDNNRYVVAKDRVGEVLKDKEFGVVKDIKGKDLIGKKYKPLFSYYANDKKLENRGNGWKIYGADFVSTNEGTGVVHIAPAFGEDDMNLGKKEKLPFIQHVLMDGKIKKEASDFVGLLVKPKENHQSTDVEIIKYLAKNNNLFSKEQINHSYPFCWRCDTPLLNYAASSWFVNVAKIKNKLLNNNKKINWIPPHLKDGRFGKWLEGVRDWAISRSRYWGAPLPVWRCDACEKNIAIGSLKELSDSTVASGNRYFILRHGEAESNHQRLNSCWPEKTPKKLTEKGEKQIQKIAELLSNKKIDLIFSSDLLRTKQTAEIVSKKIKKPIKFDKRLRELNIGIFNGRTMEEYERFIGGKKINQFIKTPEGGENANDVRKRMMDFILEVDGKYIGKNILIVSHGDPLWILEATVQGLSDKKIIETENNYIQTGELREIKLLNLPYSEDGRLNLHRPRIDQIKLKCPKCREEAKRIPEVFDCWFESGSMPYGQAHYPFENKNEFEKNFPAEFIAEGIDQTRGWFYTLLVLSTALFNKPTYKNVIVNGIILAENGEKMSKRLKNYPDPMEIVDKYGADALRYYLLSSPAVRGEDLNFSEKGVDEVYKKVISRLWNVYKFYELYAGGLKAKSSKLKAVNVLDKWILSRLEELKMEVSKWLDKYELDKAARPIADFIDDLSTWYIRRSRERFKTEDNDKKATIMTTEFALVEFSKIIAPFMPFMAETIYQQLTTNDQRQKTKSVHLEEWPKINKELIDKKLLEAMAEIRRIASLALEARAKVGIKVRQPLSELRIKNLKLMGKKELLEILADEINVKNIVFDDKINPSAGGEIELDTIITPELKIEGQSRDLVRIIQDLRKEAGFTPKDKIYLWLEAPKEIEFAVNKYHKDFQEKINAKNIEFKRVEKFDAEEETQIDGQKIWLGIKKV